MERMLLFHRHLLSNILQDILLPVHYQTNILTSITPQQRKKFKELLVVDDIYDKGKTATTVENLMRPAECEFVFLVIRNGSQKANYHVTAGRDLRNDKRWVRFPWETGTEKRRKDIASAITI